VTGSAASENYHMTKEHLHVGDLSVSNVMKMQSIFEFFFLSSWMRIPYAWILDNYEFTVFCAVIRVAV
jgi:hypothetical protein